MKFFKNGDLSIFVVNHRRDGHFVEIFDYRGGKLVHRISPDGQTVYVAATVGQKIYVYDRDRNTGDLSLRSTIDVGTGVDNIEIDLRGDLWVGSHPKLLTFVKYSKDPGVLSPSQVIKVEKKTPDQYDVKEIYLNNGQPMSGSSVAAVFEDTLLIGSVFDERFLLCNLQN
jgi:arylesterase/paraoxonase